MNYILALIPTRFHDRAKAVIGLVGIGLTLALALPGAPVWLPLVVGTLTAYGVYQVPNIPKEPAAPLSYEAEYAPDDELIYDGE